MIGQNLNSALAKLFLIWTRSASQLTPNYFPIRLGAFCLREQLNPRVLKLEPMARIEPAISPLPRACSTTEPHGQKSAALLKQPDANSLTPTNCVEYVLNCFEFKVPSQIA
jgi:hypothetical protein